MEATKKDWVDFQKIKDEVSFEKVFERLGLQGIRRDGAELVGVCPLHGGEKKSFAANDDKGVFHCFGCDKKGSVIDFVRLYQKVSVKDAGKWLAEMLENGRGQVAEDAKPKTDPSDVETLVLALFEIICRDKERLAKKIVRLLVE